MRDPRPYNPLVPASLISVPEFARVNGASGDRDAILALLADMCRANALVAVKRAGSGHLGSSFSALDIVVHLLFEELDTAELGFDHPARDVFFSSKGPDVHALTTSARASSANVRAFVRFLVEALATGPAAESSLASARARG